MGQQQYTVSPNQRDAFVYRIISGHYTAEDFTFSIAPIEVSYFAAQLYLDTLNEAIFEGVMTEAEMLSIMYSLQLWDEERETELTDALPKHIEYFQKEIFRHFYEDKYVEQTRKYLAKARERTTVLFQERSAYNYLTAEGLAIFAKIQHIVSQTTTVRGKSADWSVYSLRDALEAYYGGLLDDSVIRTLARTNPWRDIWTAGKKTGDLFGKPAIQLSDDQRRLIIWSSLYDNVLEYPDCPDEEIIQDDDAFDGWLLIKQEERDKERGVRKVERRAGKNAGADEVFIPVGDGITAKEVYGTNDMNAKAIIKHRTAVMDKLGEAKDTDFNDVKMKINNLRNAR